MGNKFNNTPGPWVNEKMAFGSRITSPNMTGYANGDKPCIARVYRHKRAKGIKHYHDDIEADANARLIAASLEMRDALLRIMSFGYIIDDMVIAIEHAPGMTIDEAIKAYEEQR